MNSSGSNYSWGQWFGSSWMECAGGREAKIYVTVNIQRRNPTFAQIQSFLPEDTNWRTVAYGVLQDDGATITIDSPSISVFDVKTGIITSIDKFLRNKGITRPTARKTVHVISSKGRITAGTFSNDLGEKGRFELVNTTHDDAEEADHTLSWGDFKGHVAEHLVEKDSLIFRGQGDNKYKLRTSFHRAGRNDLVTYLRSDIPQPRHAVNALGHFHYQSDDPEHLGALLSLGQHHGFPTPLLDWTSSPYIAAYFAFTDPSPKTSGPQCVRIFVFETQEWSDIPSANLVADPMPNLTFLRCEAYNNPRFIPQQSIASFTNRDDVEAHIRAIEVASGRRHLTTIDIPYSEKSVVLRDLRYMGITHATMFPGLDGVCRTLRERDFC